jgi:hypothetical protein
MAPRKDLRSVSADNNAYNKRVLKWLKDPFRTYENFPVKPGADDP